MELYRWYILKYGAYALLAVALFRLQSIPGLLEIGGVRPLPVAALAFLVVNMEWELPGVLFCIYVSYTYLRAHETPEHLVCRLLLEKKTQNLH